MLNTHTSFSYSSLSALCVLSLLLQAYTGYSQSLKFKRYTTDNGLPHNVGYDIHQDQKGYIWLAMDNGLSRFDGVEFKYYSVENGLNGPYVITLSEDTLGGMWAGNHNSGINYILDDTVSESQIPHIFSDAKITHHTSGDILINENTPDKRRCSCIIGRMKKGDQPQQMSWYNLVEEEGKLIWNVLDSIMINKSYRTYRRYHMNEKSVDVKLRQSQDGRIFLLTSLGVFRYIPQDSRLFVREAILPAMNFLDMNEDAKGNLWFLSEKGLYQVDTAQKLNYYPLPHFLSKPFIQMRVIHPNQVVLLDPDRTDMYFWDISSNKVEKVSDYFTLQNLISFIEKDKENNIWFSTMGDGLFCFYKNNFDNYTKVDGLNNLQINAIREDRDASMLVATLKGLFRIQGHVVSKVSWYEKFIEKPYASEVYDVLPVENNAYFFTNKSGFHLLSPTSRLIQNYTWSRNKKIDLFNQDSLAIINPYDGSSTRKIDFFNIKTLEKRSSLVKGIPTMVLKPPIVHPRKDKKGYWLRPKKGLYVIEGDSAYPYPLPPTLESEVINCIITGPKEDNWFGTEKGILRYDGGELVWMNKEMGWPIFPCRQLVFDKTGILWIATPGGLYSWDGKLLNKYTTTFGLISNDIRTLSKDSQNQLWVGTSSGVSKVNLDKFPLISTPPDLRLEQIRVDGKPILKQELKEIRQQQRLQVSYAAISFRSPAGAEYAYQLREGDTWQYTKIRSISLDNVQAGVYQLKIKARNNSAWSQPITLSFEIRPPWYRRIWAYILFGTVLMSIILLSTFFWGRYVKKKTAIKNQLAYEKAQLKLQVLQSQLNPHFIFNALNVIQGYILENDVDASNTYLERFSHLMRRFLESAKHNEIMLSEEIELLNLFVEMEQLCYEGRFRYHLHIEPDLPTESIWIPSMLLQPFVENAIHHGLLKQPKYGTLEIHFYQKDTSLICDILDDGIGREKSNRLKNQADSLHVSRGMQIVSERLKMQNYLTRKNIDIKIQDRTGVHGEIEGTHVQITCPLIRANLST